MADAPRKGRGESRGGREDLRVKPPLDSEERRRRWCCVRLCQSLKWPPLGAHGPAVTSFPSRPLAAGELTTGLWGAQHWPRPRSSLPPRRTPLAPPAQGWGLACRGPTLPQPSPAESCSLVCSVSYKASGFWAGHSQMRCQARMWREGPPGTRERVGGTTWPPRNLAEKGLPPPALSLPSCLLVEGRPFPQPDGSLCLRS